MENKVKVWLARDKNNRLFAFSERPNKEKDIWKLQGDYSIMELSFMKFPSVKWEDDEPTEAYITLAEPQEQSKPKQEIDWEQRRYEIAKDLYVQYSNTDEKGAICCAEKFINELKKNK